MLVFEHKNDGDIGSSSTFLDIYWNYSFGDLDRNITANLTNINVADTLLNIDGIEEESSSFNFALGWFMRRKNYQYGILYNYSFSSTTSSNGISLQYKHNF